MEAQTHPSHDMSTSLASTLVRFMTDNYHDRLLAGGFWVHEHKHLTGHIDELISRISNIIRQNFVTFANCENSCIEMQLLIKEQQKELHPIYLIISAFYSGTEEGIFLSPRRIAIIITRETYDKYINSQLPIKPLEEVNTVLRYKFSLFHEYPKETTDEGKNP